MTRQELLLVMLMEECDETSQRASKALRFTLEEVQEGQIMTNAERIIYEFNDLCAVMELLNEEGLFNKASFLDHEYIKLKKTKVEKWLKYSQEIGTLTNPIKQVTYKRIETN